MTTAIETLAQTIRVSQACAVLGFPRSSLYRSRQANVCLEKPLRLPSARALSDGERAVVRGLLGPKGLPERFVDRSPYEVYATVRLSSRRSLA